MSVVILALSGISSLYAENVPPPTVVPEPSSILLMVAGVAGAVYFAKKRKSKR